MSIDSGVVFQLEPHGSTWQFSVLESLAKTGWRMDDHGRVIYLPLEDEGDYNWSALTPDAGNIHEIFRAKLQRGEPLGIVLSWQGTEIGGAVIIDSASGTLAFSASMNRRCMAGSSTTDVTWYLEKLLPAFEHAGVFVASWEWTEVR